MEREKRKMALLDVNEISAGYNVPILHNVSFSLNEREFVALLGRNGSGKTTLLRTLTGSVKASNGSVSINGQDVLSLTVRKRARLLSLMSQRSGLLEGLQVGEVICMGRYAFQGTFTGISPKEKQLAYQVAKQLGIAPLWKTDCSTISEGQRQLVHLARVTVQDASILLLDEPNSALDFENSQLIFSHIKRMSKQNGHAALAVLHDPMIALHWCDRLLRLEKGRITGSIYPQKESLEVVQDFLSSLYPGILIKKDPDTGSFYCIPDE